MQISRYNRAFEMAATTHTKTPHGAQYWKAA